MASTPYWKLRRLSARALRVIDRRKNEQPVLAAYEARLVPAARTFNEIYDSVGRYETTWRRELAEGRGAARTLLTRMQAWMPLVQRDVPGFEGASYGDKPSVPDDVIEDASRLCDLVNEHGTDGGKPLPYANAMIKELEPLLVAARKEWQEAEASDKRYQQLLAQSRAAATALEAELQPFRRTLATIVGRTDTDYQKLRTGRAHVTDADDDTTVSPPPAPVASAPAGVNTPTMR